MRNKKNVEYTSRLIDNEINFFLDYSNYSSNDEVFNHTKEVDVDSEQMSKMKNKMRSPAGLTTMT
ncbi:MAG: hypothetical protein GZ091_14835 [Paludibacter sp.]|nr:hypothetical protein [Paludibacter sp.]